MSRLPAPRPGHLSFVCVHCGAKPLTRLPFPYRVFDGYEVKR